MGMFGERLCGELGAWGMGHGARSFENGDRRRETGKMVSGQSQSQLTYQFLQNLELEI